MKLRNGQAYSHGSAEPAPVDTTDPFDKMPFSRAEFRLYETVRRSGHINMLAASSWQALLISADTHKAIVSLSNDQYRELLRAIGIDN